MIMRMYDILETKRDKSELSKEMIDYFVQGVTDGSIPDYQISALLMAICINGMNARETCDLTLAMAHSGSIADLSSIKGHRRGQAQFGRRRRQVHADHRADRQLVRRTFCQTIRQGSRAYGRNDR